jgi:hypothetical protein
MPAGSKQPIVVHYTEHSPPDVGAAFIWLKNRDPQHWRESLRERIEMLCSTPLSMMFAFDQAVRSSPEEVFV